jgi:hypothetical protein
MMQQSLGIVHPMSLTKPSGLFTGQINEAMHQVGHHIDVRRILGPPPLLQDQQAPTPPVNPFRQVVEEKAAHMTRSSRRPRLALRIDQIAAGRRQHTSRQHTHHSAGVHQAPAMTTTLP